MDGGFERVTLSEFVESVSFFAGLIFYEIWRGVTRLLALKRAFGHNVLHTRLFHVKMQRQIAWIKLFLQLFVNDQSQDQSSSFLWSNSPPSNAMCVKTA